jgi:hypothetical protein
MGTPMSRVVQVILFAVALIVPGCAPNPEPLAKQSAQRPDTSSEPAFGGKKFWKEQEDN